MKKELKPLNKEILSDPVTAYRRQAPGDNTGDNTRDNTEQLGELSELSVEYREQQSRYQDIHNQSGQLSREIGETKRNGLPIDNLKEQMQAYSMQAKEIAARIRELESRILAFFTPQNGGEEANNRAGSSPQTNPQGKRHYTGTDNHGVHISLLKPEQPEAMQAWNRYAADNPAASIYHRAEWRELIHATFGHEGHYFQAVDTATGKIVGILPLIRLKSRLFGDFLVSMPYFNYGGAVADSPDIEKLLMDAANAQAVELGVTHIEYRDDIPRPGFPVRTDKVNMILSLADHEDKLWQGFTPKLRAQIRRPQRENPQVQFGGEELLEDFYRVFARNMRDLGTPVYGKSLFRNILRIFPEQSCIVVVRLSKRAVAAAFLLGQRDTLEIPWASTVRDVNHLSMNMLMYWEVLRFAIRNNYRYFDFGRSSKKSGTYRFKQQWGAISKPLYWHYWLTGGGDMPSLNPNNPKYALVIAAWKRLPIPLTKWIGPKIVKNLP